MLKKCHEVCLRFVRRVITAIRRSGSLARREGTSLIAATPVAYYLDSLLSFLGTTRTFLGRPFSTTTQLHQFHFAPFLVIKQESGLNLQTKIVEIVKIKEKFKSWDGRNQLQAFVVVSAVYHPQKKVRQVPSSAAAPFTTIFRRATRAYASPQKK